MTDLPHIEVFKISPERVRFESYEFTVVVRNAVAERFLELAEEFGPAYLQYVAAFFEHEISAEETREAEVWFHNMVEETREALR